MYKLVSLIYDFFDQNKKLYYTVLFTSILALAVLATYIKIDTDVSSMMPKDKTLSSVVNALKGTKLSEQIFFLIKPTKELNEDNLADVTDLFVDDVKKSLPSFISNIRYSSSDQDFNSVYNVLQENFPYFLEEADYDKIDSLITEESIRSSLQANYQTLLSPSGIVFKSKIINDPLGISDIVFKKLERLKPASNLTVSNGLFTTDSGKTAVIILSPSFSSTNADSTAIFINHIDDLIAKHAQTSDIEILYYGAAAVSHSNASQLKKDTLLTLSITIIGLFSFLFFYFKRKRVVFLVFAPVLFGGLFSISILAVTQQTISAIAIAAGSIVLGIGLTFSLHFIHHFKHSQSVKETIKELLLPLSIGSFTTIAAFFSLKFVSSPILNDFGLFASYALMGTSFFTLIFLPPLLPTMPNDESIIEKWMQKDFTPNRWFVFSLILITIFLSFFIKDVDFNSDFNQLNFQHKKLSEAELEVGKLQNTKSKTVNLGVEAENMDMLLSKNFALKNYLNNCVSNQKIDNYSSVADFLIPQEEQEKRASRWNKYFSASRISTVKKMVESDAISLGFKPYTFKSFYEKMEGVNPTLNVEQMNGLVNALGQETINKSTKGYLMLSSITLDKEKRPMFYEELSSALDVRILDKQLISNSLVNNIYNNFNTVLLYCSVIVFIALLLGYGRIELTIITFLPMVQSWLWILGLMGLLRLKFNIVNVVISTFIFGLGDDFSIFITDALNRKFKTGKNVLASHRTAIFLSAITTIFGLGVLIFAKHPALRSIAWLSIIGLFSVIIIGQTFQPLLYNFFIQHRKDKGLAPWTLRTLLLSTFAFMYFAFWSIVLSVFALIWIHVLPFPSISKRKYVLHIVLSKFVKSLVYLMANVKKVHINKQFADFSKPCVFVCNHQSFLDILVTVMQHPKIILLTNEWVYHSPFFGRLVQLADYYPVAEGAEMGIERLRKKVEQGYSIVVFPEGTRSVDGKIGRFKKGAFYIAEMLNLDIQPLLLHGTGHTMRKGDFMLYDGQMTMSFLPRIAPDDTSFGVGYAERAKLISRYFKLEYLKLSQIIETPKYYKQRLEMNYVYKGPVEEWYARQKAKVENYYEVYHQHISPMASVTDIGCGYGLLAYMLNFLSPDRKLIGVDHDEDKIEMANHNFSKNDKLNFVTHDIVSYPYESQDVFVINDVLHYINYDEQKFLLNKLSNLLNPDGAIIIKDGDLAKSQNHKMTKLSELFSNVLGFNFSKHNQLYFFDEKYIKELAASIGFSVEVIDTSRATSNTIWLLKKLA